MVIEVDERQRLEDMEEKIVDLKRVIGLLIADQAIGNVLKGPFRLPDKAQPSRAFQ